MAKPNLERLAFLGLAGILGIALVAGLQLVLGVWFPIAAPLGAFLIVALAAALYIFVMRVLIMRVEERRQRFAAIFAEHPDAIAVYNVDGKMVRGNPAAAALAGWGNDLVGKTWTEHIVPDERTRVVEQFRNALKGQVAKFETRFLHRSGEQIPVICYLVPTIVNGQVVSVVGTARDMRETRRAAARERMLTDRISILAEIISKHAARPSQQIHRILEFTCTTLGMDEGAVSSIAGDTLTVRYCLETAVRVGHTVPFAKTFARHTYGAREVLAIPDTAAEQWKDDAAVIHQAWKSYIGVTIFVESTPYGILSFTRCLPRADFDAADRDFVRIAAALVGSTLERIRSDSELAVAAMHDKLTGLLNRAAFEEELRKLIARVKRQDGHVRVHFIDLDGFKAVNDTIGHAAGDEVLRIVAARFRALVRDEDVLARFGGDEFVVLEWTRKDEGGSTALGDRIVAATSELMYVDDRIVRLGASVGVASYPRDADTEEGLLKCADAAMYSAKSAGKGSVRRYSYG